MRMTEITTTDRAHDTVTHSNSPLKAGFFLRANLTSRHLTSLFLYHQP